MADAEFPALKAGYVLCGERRSGSTYLGELLASTRALGTPRDYFNPTAVWDTSDDAFDAERRLQALVAGVTSNGIYGLKIFPDEFELAVGTSWAERLPDLKFIHLRRADRLGQAISAARAAQTGEWFSTSRRGAAPVYDGRAVRRELRRVVLAEARWLSYFARNDIVPLELWYERIVEQPQEAVDAVATIMGLSERASIDPGRTTLNRQRDAVSRDWRAQFVAEHSDRTTLETLTNLPVARWAAIRWPVVARIGRRLGAR